MKAPSASFLLAMTLPLMAAVDGIVMNGTTGKPQEGVPVILIQPSEKGMQPLGKAVSDAAGKFAVDKDAVPTAPILLQATYKGVAYTKTVPMGQPTTGMNVEVFESTNKREGVAVDRHGILLEPAEGKLSVREFVFVNNTSKTTFLDPAEGSYRFWAPDAAKVEVTLTSQGGMPVKREPVKAGSANTWKVDYPMRPGQTQIEISYETAKADTFTGNVLHKEGETRLIVPKGLALKGDGLEEFAPEPRTQAAIYGVKNGPFSVAISGRAEPPAERASEDTGAPEISPGRPRIYSRLYWILGITGAILCLGLYTLAKSK